MNNLIEALLFTACVVLCFAVAAMVYPIILVLNSRRALKRLRRYPVDAALDAMVREKLTQSEPLMISAAIVPSLAVCCVLAMASMLDTGVDILTAIILMVASCMVLLFIIGYIWLVWCHWRHEIKALMKAAARGAG